MKWNEISKKRPQFGELIWVWDIIKQQKFLITYLGSEESWLDRKEDINFPIWAYLNDDENEV